jgi:hypothetical protein
MKQGSVMRHGSSSSSDLVFGVGITELSNELVIDDSAADAKLHCIVPMSFTGSFVTQGPVL